MNHFNGLTSRLGQGALTLLTVALLSLASCRHAQPPAPAPPPAPAISNKAVAAKSAAPALASQSVLQSKPKACGWIAGMLTNVQGAVLSSAQLWYVSTEGRADAYVSAAIAVASNGQYVAGPIRQGVYTFCLKAQWHVLSRETDAVRNGETTDVAFAIEPLGPEVPVVTGVVVDAETKAPLGGVRIHAQLQRGDKPPEVASWIEETDCDGLFRLCCSNEVGYIHLAKKDYAPAYASAVEIAHGGLTVMLSRTSHVRVHVLDDLKMPMSNVMVVSSVGEATVKGGLAILSNVPVTSAPLTLRVRSRRFLLASNVVERLVAGESVDSTIYVPALGRLVLRFNEPGYSNEFGRSIMVSGMGTTNHADRNCFSRDEFDLNASGDRVLDFIPPEEYNVSVDGDDVVNFKTNLVINGGRDTELMLRVGSNSVGTICGVLDNGTRFTPMCQIRACLAGSSQEVRQTRAMVSTNGFKIAGLDAREVYDVHVNAQMWLASTNIVVRNVRPNSEPLRIMLDRAYEVRGTVVDEHGDPLKCMVMLWFEKREADDGIFVCGPLMPGPFILGIHADGYAPYVRDVEIINSDVDVGAVVMRRGATVKGMLRYADGSPCPNGEMIFVRLPIELSPGIENTVITDARSDEDGRFVVSNVARDVKYRLLVSRENQVAAVDVDSEHGDCSLGNVNLRMKSYLIVNVLAPDGTPARDIKDIAGLESVDREAGVWEGREPETIPLMNELVLLPEIDFRDGPHMEDFARIIRAPCTAEDSRTNRVTIRLTTEQWRKLKK